MNPACPSMDTLASFSVSNVVTRPLLVSLNLSSLPPIKETSLAELSRAKLPILFSLPAVQAREATATEQANRVIQLTDSVAGGSGRRVSRNFIMAFQHIFPALGSRWVWIWAPALFCGVLLMAVIGPASADQKVIGCEGRVKSEIPIDYNKINVGLYTEHGSLKDTTDCAPSNGYFFIPIYDLAKYKIKV